jgi:hypothetical protein
MAEHDDILRKIKSCLAMAQSDNPNEAATALRRAQELMEKYGVTSDDVAISDVNSSMADARSGRVPPAHIAMLANMVGRAFGVELVYNASFDGNKWRAAVEFYGLNAAPEVAAYTYEVLVRQLTKDRSGYIATLNKRIKRTTKVRRGDMYAKGWVRAVADKVPSHFPTEAETKAIEAYKAKRWPEELETTSGRDLTTKARNHDYGALSKGFADGRKVDFRQGVAGERQEALDYGGGQQ